MLVCRVVMVFVGLALGVPAGGDPAAEITLIRGSKGCKPVPSSRRHRPGASREELSLGFGSIGKASLEFCLSSAPATEHFLKHGVTEFS